MRYIVTTGGERYEVAFVDRSEGLALVENPAALPVEVLAGGGPIRRCRIGDRTLAIGVVREGGTYRIVLDGVEHVVDVIDARLEDLAERGVVVGRPAAGQREIVAPIPGRVVRVLVEPGQEVAAREVLLVLDAMKLENEILSPRSAVVAAVEVEAGQAVEKGQVMIRFEDPA